MATTLAPLRQRRTRLQWRLSQAIGVVFVADALVLMGVNELAWTQRGLVDGRLAALTTLPPDPARWLPAIGPWLVAMWLATLVLAGGYNPRALGVGFEEFRSIVVGSVVAFGLFGVVGFLVRSELSRGYPVLFFLVGTPVLLGLRYAERKAVHLLRVRGRLVNRTIAVGAPGAVAELVGVLERERWTGYQVLGMCTPTGVPAGMESAVPVLGGVEDVPRLAGELGADTVLVAGGSYSSARDLRRLGWAIEGLDLDLLVVPSLTDVAGPRVHMATVAGLPLVHVGAPRVGEAGGAVKRFFDAAAAALLLLLISPLLLATAVAIRLDDPGPVLYRQRRIGIAGEAFDMLKFRSMVVGADSLVASLSSEVDVLFKVRADPRVTRVGHWLRRFSIDELPQLVNVLRGEMSLVGPRPPLAAEVERYDSDVHRRLLVRPGMTGLWQVSGRSDLSWDEAVRLDLYYVDNWSLVGDLVIMLKTVRAVLVGRGAY